MSYGHINNRVYLFLSLSLSEQQQQQHHTMRRTLRLIAQVIMNRKKRNKKEKYDMIKVCKSCGKEFQNLSEGVLYSSFARGVLEFCSDDCSKNYLNSLS